MPDDPPDVYEDVLRGLIELGVPIIGSRAVVTILEDEAWKRTTWERPGELPNRRPLTTALRKAVLERDAYRCRECDGWTDLEVDHVIPASAGGSDHLTNLQTLCRGCNRRKGVQVCL